MPFCLLLTLAAISIFVRCRLLSMPFERDEGEYAYMARLFSYGLSPYKDAYSLKWPGAFFAYAAAMGVFGVSDVGVRAGLLVTNFLTLGCLILWVRRLYGGPSALWSGAIFVLWSLSPALLGEVAHATQFLVLCAVPGFLLLHRALEERRSWDALGAGILFGLAMLMKQHAVFFSVYGAGALLWTGRGQGWRRQISTALLLVLGSLLPVGLLVLYYAVNGNLGAFWFWTVTYARAYTQTSSAAVAWDSFYKALTRQWVDGPLWWLAAGGLLLLWLRRLPHRGFLTGLLVAALLTVVPGFYFRPHYWVPVIPIAALLAGVALWQLMETFRSHRTLLIRLLPGAALGALLFNYFQTYGPILFLLSPDDASRRLYPGEVFPEIKQLAQSLKTNTNPGSRIAVLGSEPQLYFYADRRAATGFLYTFPLMENQPFAFTMQQQMAREVEQSNPPTLVYVNVYRSWFPQPGANPYIFNWFEQFSKRYEVQGVVDVLPHGTRVISGPEAASYQPQSDSVLTVWQKRP